MTDESPEHKRWITARHESGHAVAGLHYNCPIAFTSIEQVGDALGTTRMLVEEAGDAVVVFCGPLAEKDWEVYVPGTEGPTIHTLGPDQEALEMLKLEGHDLNVCLREALYFISQPQVQQQIDRVVHALLERGRMTSDEVREVAGFVDRLCSAAWR